MNYNVGYIIKITSSGHCYPNYIPMFKLFEFKDQTVRKRNNYPTWNETEFEIINKHPHCTIDNSGNIIEFTIPVKYLYGVRCLDNDNEYVFDSNDFSFMRRKEINTLSDFVQQNYIAKEELEIALQKAIDHGVKSKEAEEYWKDKFKIK